MRRASEKSKRIYDWPMGIRRDTSGWDRWNRNERTVMRTYLMAGDISLGGSCWREPPLATNQRTLALFVRLPSRFSFSVSSFIIHGPHASPGRKFLPFRIVNAKA